MMGPEMCVTLFSDLNGHWRSVVQEADQSGEGFGQDAREATARACERLREPHSSKLRLA